MNFFRKRKRNENDKFVSLLESHSENEKINIGTFSELDMWIQDEVERVKNELIVSKKKRGKFHYPPKKYKDKKEINSSDRIKAIREVDRRLRLDGIVCLFTLNYAKDPYYEIYDAKLDLE